MSLPDTIFIFGLALVIFGPKKLPEMGRQLGKLMLEFRRASNEFKMQIDEELRAAEHADRQAQIQTPVTTAPVVTSNAVMTSAGTGETPVIRPPSEGTTVSSESPTSRVIPVHEEVSELAAVVGEHPELGRDALERLPEQATIHND